MLIEVTYSRNTGQTNYRVQVRVWPENSTRELMEKAVRETESKSASLDWMVDAICQMLKEFPEATVRMIRPNMEDFDLTDPTKIPPMFDLDRSFVEMMKNEPEKAKMMFEPIHQVVAVFDKEKADATDQ